MTSVSPTSRPRGGVGRNGVGARVVVEKGPFHVRDHPRVTCKRLTYTLTRVRKYVHGSTLNYAGNGPHRRLLHGATSSLGASLISLPCLLYVPFYLEKLKGLIGIPFLSIPAFRSIEGTNLRRSVRRTFPAEGSESDKVPDPQRKGSG